MPGTRTAPTVNGTPSYVVISATMYDYTGDQRTESYQVDADTTDAEIEAWVAALQPLTNGTIWKVEKREVYNSVGDSQNAIEEVWENIKDNVVLLAKDPANNSQDWYIPAPINEMFLETTETIDQNYAPLAPLLASILAMKAGYGFVSGRFTHRRQIGTKVNF